jgi:hypothetical protein
VIGQRKRQIILLNPLIAAIFCFTRQNGLSIYNTFVYTIFIRQLSISICLGRRGVRFCLFPFSAISIGVEKMLSVQPGKPADQTESAGMLDVPRIRLAHIHRG